MPYLAPPRSPKSLRGLVYLPVSAARCLLARGGRFLYVYRDALSCPPGHGHAYQPRPRRFVSRLSHPLPRCVCGDGAVHGTARLPCHAPRTARPGNVHHGPHPAAIAAVAYHADLREYAGAHARDRRPTAVMRSDLRNCTIEPLLSLCLFPVHISALARPLPRVWHLASVLLSSFENLARPASPLDLRTSSLLGQHDHVPFHRGQGEVWAARKPPSRDRRCC